MPYTHKPDLYRCICSNRMNGLVFMWRFWLVLGQCGGFWLVLGQCGGFWLVLGQCGGFWLVLGQCGGLLMLNVPNNRYDVFALTIMLEIKIHNYVYKYLIQTIQYTWPTILFTDLLYCTVFISFSCTKCLSGCSPYQKNVFFSSLA